MQTGTHIYTLNTNRTGRPGLCPSDAPGPRRAAAPAPHLIQWGCSRPDCAERAPEARCGDSCYPVTCD